MVKFVYILVSNENDFYYEQALVSILSLKYHNPDAYITLILDDQTMGSLKGNRSRILELANELKVEYLNQNLSLKIRSRYIKTNMRNIVTGDFMYIDSDTIIVDTLHVEELDVTIGAVRNTHSALLSQSPSYHTLLYNLNKCGQLDSSEEYFNGGVLFVKDTIMTRRFFSHWNDLYKKYALEFGIDADQVSLYVANINYNEVIEELPGEYNWQIGFDINFLSNAKIIHLLTTAHSNYENNIHYFQNFDVLKMIKNNLLTETEILEKIKKTKSLFNPKARIKCDNFDFNRRAAEIREFAINKELYLFCMDKLDVVAIYELRKSIEIRGIITIDSTFSEHYNIDLPYIPIDNLRVRKKGNTGILVLPIRADINQILSILLSYGFYNIYII